MRTLCFVLILSAIGSSANARDTWVNGYQRKDGTYVQGHYRSGSDGNQFNNYSYQGNVNPYNGNVGTKPYDYNRSYNPYGSKNSWGNDDD